MSGLDELLGEFLDVVPARLEELTDRWLAFEAGSAADLAALRRLIHTIKGEAHMLGLHRCGEVFEEVEEVIDAVARHGASADGVGDAILGAFDLFAMAGAARGEVDDESRASVSAMLSKARSLFPDPAGAAPRAREEVERVELVRVEAATRAVDTDELAPIVAELRRARTEREHAEVALRDAVATLRRLAPHPALAPVRDPFAEAVRRLSGAVADAAAAELLAGAAVDRVDELIRRHSVVSVHRLEGQIHRAARSLAQSLGKLVDVHVEGALHIDAAVERRLSAALVHLVRNALDHGIEAPEARALAGKRERGSVRVAFEQADDLLTVRVEDDGAGIDDEGLRQRLRAQGRDADRIGRGELYATLFEQGVTTRDVATQISGRGVGLDVVASELAAVGGRVVIESERGRGTCFVLTLPSSLRVEPVVPLWVDDVRVAIAARQLSMVIRVDDVGRDALHGATVSLPPDGTIVPVRDLGVVLGLRAHREVGAGDLVAVIEHPSGRFAVGVDRHEPARSVSAVDARDLLVESPIVAGAAALPDGGVVVVIDASRLRDVLDGRPLVTSTLPAVRPELRVLVVEDSAVVRRLVAGELRSHGFLVDEAEDGLRGIAVATRTIPDVVITDLEMPRADGLYLIEALRADPAFREVPVVVLSDTEDRRLLDRASGLGVRAIWPKQSFDLGALRGDLEAVLLGA